MANRPAPHAHPAARKLITSPGHIKKHAKSRQAAYLNGAARGQGRAKTGEITY